VCPSEKRYSTLATNLSALDLNMVPLNINVSRLNDGSIGIEETHLPGTKPYGIKHAMFCVMPAQLKGPRNLASNIYPANKYSIAS
jgi:hypothetical protein